MAYVVLTSSPASIYWIYTTSNALYQYGQAVFRKASGFVGAEGEERRRTAEQLRFLEPRPLPGREA